MTDTPDYAHMSGGEFKHAVGVDPEQWAEAFLQREVDEAAGTRLERLIRFTMWFADFAEAVRKEVRRTEPPVV